MDDWDSISSTTPAHSAPDPSDTVSTPQPRGRKGGQSKKISLSRRIVFLGLAGLVIASFASGVTWFVISGIHGANSTAITATKTGATPITYVNVTATVSPSPTATAMSHPQTGVAAVVNGKSFPVSQLFAHSQYTLLIGYTPGEFFNPPGGNTGAMAGFTDLGIDPHVGTLTPHVGRWARIVNLEDGSVELDMTDASQPLPNSWSGEGWAAFSTEIVDGIYQFQLAPA